MQIIKARLFGSDEKTMEVGLSRDRDVIDLFIGPDLKNDETTVNVVMPVADFLKLIGGNITPPEVAGQYGIPKR